MVSFSGKDNSTLLTAALLVACGLDLFPHALMFCPRSFEEGVVVVGALVRALLVHLFAQCPFLLHL